MNPVVSTEAGTVAPGRFAHPGPCAALLGLPCVPCKLAERDPRYRAAWGNPPAPGAGPLPMLMPAPGDVAALGMAPRPCVGCKDRAEAAAALGGPAPPCACKEIVPGVPDPLPGAEVQPTPAGWHNAEDVRRAHIEAFRAVCALDFGAGPPTAAGAGVVYCGGGTYWPGMTVAIRMLRDVSELPVQVWHRGAAEPIDPDDLADLDGITYHDSSAPPCVRILRGWEQKLVALLRCGLERVLYIDADAYAVSDPRPLLELAEARAPFQFFADAPTMEGKVSWPAFGLDGPNGVPPIQGGQLAIHRPGAWRLLCITHWLCQHSDYTFKHAFGDQDQWRIALAATGLPYHAAAQARWHHPAYLCALDGGPPMIVHRCQGKLNGTVTDRRAPHLPAEARAWAHRTRYVAGPPGRPAGETFARVYRVGDWGPGNVSGEGSAPRESRPYVELVRGLVAMLGGPERTRVVDLACGDGAITTQLPGVVAAVDCFGPHVRALALAVPGVEWGEMDLDADRAELPAGELALCKDVLHHWPAELVRAWLRWCRGARKWRHVLLTYTAAASAEAAEGDCPLGGFRPLSMDYPPLAGIGGLVRLCRYGNKEVSLLTCEAPP